MDPTIHEVYASLPDKARDRVARFLLFPVKSACRSLCDGPMRDGALREGLEFAPALQLPGAVAKRFSDKPRAS